jgi:maltose alpha-D-glucosyltransferase / alpha-amylase
VINDLWYKNAIIYCLSVGTFMDTNRDGIGDFQGLTRRLDYLSGLGITTIWLMPFQPTPFRDDGYDVADYYGVDKRYGTLGDFVEFAHGAKQRGMRVLIDLVVNHTSNEHPWFQEARRDPASKYRDWYVWSKKRPSNLELRQGSEGLVFPSLLRFSARSQYSQPRGSGRDPEDHGLLAATRRRGLPDGCGAVCYLGQGPGG